jgi:hypothetical protein
MTRWAAGFVLASAAWAQTPQGEIGGPALGLVFDGDTAAVRALTGIPAAATLGPAVADAAGLRNVIVSARRGYAIGIDAAGAAMLVTPTGRTAIAGAGAARIALSASGSAAAVYRSEGSVDVVAGLPEAPRVLRSVAMAGAPDALAVSDDGSAVIALTRERRGWDTVSWIGADGTATPMYRARRIEGIAFLEGSGAALVAEPQAVKLVGPGFGAQALADGLEGVVAAAASADGRRIAITMRSGEVAVLDRASGTRVSAICSCAPAALDALRGNAVFRLNETGNGPLWLLDADGPQPRILFVAAPAGGAQ